MPNLTAYQIFNVPESAPIETIRASWKALAKRYHPDTNPDCDPRIMAEINRAFEVLKDPQKRAAYDAALARERQPRIVYYPRQWTVNGTWEPIHTSASNSTITIIVG